MTKFKKLLERALLAILGERPSTVRPSPAAGDASRQGGTAEHLRAALEAMRGIQGSTMLTPITPAPRVKIEDIFKPAAPLGAQKSAGVPEMAYDSALLPSVEAAYFDEGIGFYGYQVLAQLSQRAEYRKMVEIIALDMTREWIRFTYTGGAGEKERVARIEKVFNDLGVKDKFRQVMEMDGIFGRGHIHINFGDTNDVEELRTRLLVDPRKIKKGSLKRLTVVDPTWTYPGNYNTTDPLAPYFYIPETWYVMNKEVHESRLMTFISRPLPDILKSAYAFGGLSLTQMAKPYVDNWLQMRQSVADLVNSFSVFVLKTDMSNVLNGTDATSLQARADLFNLGRRNNGLMLLNKGEVQGDEGEQLDNISVPLTGLNDLLSSAQEQMAFVAGEPIVKLIGSTPSGLNASSDGEIRVYYDNVHAAQERLFRGGLEKLLQIVQLSEFGDVDEDIGIEFMPLWQLDEKEQAETNKLDAEADAAYVNAGVLSPEEVREKLAADKSSPYADIDTSDVPEPPATGAFGNVDETDSDSDTDADEVSEPRPALAANDRRIRDQIRLHGFDVVIETRAGKRRVGSGPQGPWECVMAADYGYIDGTWSAEGRTECMDCFVGPDLGSRRVFLIDQADPWTQQFDEHKLVFGTTSPEKALELYARSHDGDARVSERIMAVSELTLDGLRHWLETGDLYRPYAAEADESRGS